MIGLVFSAIAASSNKRIDTDANNGAFYGLVELSLVLLFPVIVPINRAGHAQRYTVIKRTPQIV